MTAPRYQWQPTTADIAARFGLTPDRVVRFDHNTSPYPTEWVHPLIAPMSRNLNEYPAASYADLRVAAAGHYGVLPENVVPGAGVDEILLLIARAYLGPGKRAATVEPTYPLYEIATLQTGAEFRTVSYTRPDFGFPAEAAADAAATSDVTWLCVPNNPTGHRQSDDDIAEIVAAARGFVVIDAAYAEYTGDRWASWLDRFEHLIVCHTLSKGFGLAGARVGFALAHPSLIDRLDAVRPPGSISTLSAGIARAALAEPQRMHRHVDNTVTERSRFQRGLEDAGIDVVPHTATNFLLCEFGDAAHPLATALMQHGLVVRSFRQDHALHGFLRFTVRSRDENSRLIDTLRSITT